MLIYIHDVSLLKNNNDRIDKTKAYLDEKFSIKNLGSVKYFLSVETTQTLDKRVLSQRKYPLVIDCNETLQNWVDRDLNLTIYLSLKHTLFTVLHLSTLVIIKDFWSLKYFLSVETTQTLDEMMLSRRKYQLDICPSRLTAQFVSNGANIPLDDVDDTTLAYVFFLQLGIPCLRLLETWIGFPHTRRSKIGYFITLGGASISWNIKKQYVVFKSFAEAEY
uniref:Reverse transcriptase Ty1/copia-type domain-containing protein n=1 Tax=Lactuca sativa TaxID=4236 RepID=A0A9R1X833_LACSA|nr:hypothetical protein LSAT_V11C600316840 [Lactuca sativa]